MRIKRATLALAAAALVVTGLAQVAVAAAGERHARVAGGQTVTLADSRLSQSELEAMRPGMASLIPGFTR